MEITRRNLFRGATALAVGSIVSSAGIAAAVTPLAIKVYEVDGRSVFPFLDTTGCITTRIACFPYIDTGEGIVIYGFHASGIGYMSDGIVAFREEAIASFRRNHRAGKVYPKGLDCQMPDHGKFAYFSKAEVSRWP